jgi:hypothetical protein
MFDTFFVSWRENLFSVSSDGENTMTGRHSGVQTLLAQQTTNSILRIVCVPHQCDLVIKKVTKEMDDENVYKTAHTFSVHLGAQANLVTDMKSKCPKDTTRWLAFGKLLDWMLDQRVCLLEHIESKRPVQALLDIWWILAAGVHPLYKMMNITMTSLQAPLLVLSQQRCEVKNLVSNLYSGIGIFLVAEDRSYESLE